MKVPVVVHCPPVVVPSAQSVMASGQSLPLTSVPPCDPCDSQLPDRGRPQVRPVPLIDRRGRPRRTRLLGASETSRPRDGLAATARTDLRRRRPPRVARWAVIARTQPSAFGIEARPERSCVPGRGGTGECPGAMAELVLDQRAQLAESFVIFGDQEQRIVAEPRRPAWLAGQTARGRHPRLRAGSFRRDRQAPSAQRNAAPAAVVGGLSRGRPAPCDCWPRHSWARRRTAPKRRPGHRPVRRLSGPNRRRRPRPTAPGPAPRPSCGRCRRTCRHPRRPRARPGKSSTERIISRSRDRLGSQGGAISSAISLHFLRLREPRTSTIDGDASDLCHFWISLMSDTSVRARAGTIIVSRAFLPAHWDCPCGIGFVRKRVGHRHRAAGEPRRPGVVRRIERPDEHPAGGPVVDHVNRLRPAAGTRRPWPACRPCVSASSAAVSQRAILQVREHAIRHRHRVQLIASTAPRTRQSEGCSGQDN